MKHNEMILFEDQGVKLEVNMKDETVWLSQQQMAKLFNSSRTNIIEHINYVYASGELEKDSTCQDFRLVRLEGKRNVAITLLVAESNPKEKSILIDLIINFLK